MNKIQIDKTDLLSKIHQHNRKYTNLIFLLCCTLALSLIFALCFGATSIPFEELLIIFSGNGADTGHTSTILFDLRLPRVLMAATVGSLLAICGTVLQGLFRNPLADPSLIGVSAGASLGASTVIFFCSIFSFSFTAFNLNELIVISIGACIGGALSAILVYRLSKNQYTGGISVASMLLAGIAISALSGSLTSLIDFYANNETLRRISLWRMGSLDGASYTKVLVLSVFIFFSFTIIFRFYTHLNAFLLGESEARHLGINTEKTKKFLIIFVASTVGVCVAFTGMIGFVGLVVPHFVRMLLGPDHKILIPSSMIAGAILLVLADLISRIILAPTQLPIGVVTAIIGAPLFLSMLRNRYSYGGRR